jgi:hypothetical protein
MGRPVIELTGKVFNRLTVRKYVGSDKWGHSEWLCECKCGNACVVRGGNLTNRYTQACGCLRGSGRGTTMHGHTKKGKSSPEYQAWDSMCRRAENRNSRSPSYTNVHVCKRWRKFVNFLADMGPRPSTKHSLSRISDTGDYCPGNVVWGTLAHQLEQKRSKRALMLAA